MSYYSVFCVLVFYIAVSHAFRFRLNFKNEMLGSPFNSERSHSQHIYGSRPEAEIKKDTVMFIDQYFLQKLDHSRPTDQTTWQQRYFVNDLFYEKGGPIFLMVEGESEASSKWMQKVQWILYAKKFNALCFALEHRFYGKSRPKNTTNVENLIYLSTEQELADVAYFIEGMKVKYDIPNDTKWILFGGSYAGSLVAWARLKYPHLVYGAIASSAPLLAQTDFPEYLEVVKKSLATHSTACVENIATANRQLKVALKSESGRSKISKLFKLCSPLENNTDDISTLIEMLSDSIAFAVQYNRKIFSINDVCSIMNKKGHTPLKRYAKLNEKFIKLWGESCLSHEYAKWIEEFRNTSYSYPQSSRLWIYQTCTEYGFYQTSSETTDLFGDYFPLNYFIKMCQDIFGLEFDKNLIDDAVDRTNLEFGALKYNISNVVFVHGSLDPWQALGITEKSKNAAYDLIYIKGATHCGDMYAPTEQDIAAVKIARRQIFEKLSSWLKTESEEKECKNNTTTIEIQPQSQSVPQVLFIPRT